MNKEKIIYPINGLKRPHNGIEQKMFLKINSLPIIRNLNFIKRMFCKSFGLPFSTSFNKDFYCSAPNIKVGNNVGLADTYILAYAPVFIGEGTSFSFRNMIITSTHEISNFSTIIAKPISIGRKVWITTNVTILPGVSIGDNTIIGAGSVVTKDIPPNVFAAGNPCEVIREIEFVK